MLRHSHVLRQVEFKYLHEGKGGQAPFGNEACPLYTAKEARENFVATGGAAWDPGGAEWRAAESTGLRRRNAASTSG
jgi:hypothetical protein